MLKIISILVLTLLSCPLWANIPLGQLPKDVVPTHYALSLHVDPDKDTFSGAVEITININKDTDVIWLHGQHLEVTNSYVVLEHGHQLPASYEEVDKTGVAKLSLKGMLNKVDKQATINIQYKAAYNKSLEGLYKVKDGEHHYAFTQFEATSGRMAFPSFDDPGFKTPFDVTLQVKSSDIAIANTPVTDMKELSDHTKRYRFATTTPLPTYLIAFAVGPFDVVDGGVIPPTKLRKKNIAFRGITVKGKGKKMRYALDNTIDIVKSLENYFGIAYPYKKLDLIAVPDFSAGAMENVGAITYREERILFDENTSLRLKRRFLSIHAHELAHQWFGNYVTPVWWDDIWLNEAFATWMAAHTLHELQPDQGFDEGLTRRAFRVMKKDSLISARQIRQPIISNHDISNAFDGITYSKGGAVLSMFESFIGPDKFKEGIQHYMKKFAHGNASAEDFIETIAEKSAAKDKKQLKNAFISFLEQPGIPHLKIRNVCRHGMTILTIEQSRYLPLGSKGKTDNQWKIPYCFSYEIIDSQFKHCTLIEKPVQKVVMRTGACPNYIMPNADGAGYFRWTLKNRSLKPLMKKMDKLNTNEQIALADSLSAAFKQGSININTYLNSLPEVIASDAWQVSVSPMDNLRDIHDYLIPADQQKRVRDYMKELYQEKLQNLGLRNNTEADKKDPTNTNELRTRIVDFLAIDGKNKTLREELTKLAKNYVGYGKNNQINPEAINPDLVKIALEVATDELGKEFYDVLIQLLNNSRDAAFRNSALKAIGSSKDKTLAAQSRQLILSESLRDNEIDHILKNQSEFPGTREQIWRWVQANLDSLLKRIPTWRQGSKTAEIGDGFCSKHKREEVNNFFKAKAKDLEGGPRSLANTLENIDLCIAWKLHHQKQAIAYFKQ